MGRGMGCLGGKYITFLIEVMYKAGNRPIGSVGLSDVKANDHNASFGIDIGEKECWGKGYGTEAARLILKYGFEQLNLHRIYSEVWSFNERSLRMHLKVGFKEEGRQREAVYKNGTYHGIVMFGMLKDEWGKLEPTERDSPLP